jgi:CO dehydrogenase maturation factor
VRGLPWSGLAGPGETSTLNDNSLELDDAGLERDIMGRSVKLAISGKGGVGKSTLAAALALLMARQGRTVLAVDADPAANLAAALGIAPQDRKQIVPIAERKALIEERTGAKVKQYGQIFKLNPEVSDIAETCAYRHHGVLLLVLGAVQQAAAGCACPESVLLRALIQDLVLHKNEAVVLDMEAGIEHLGRATARGVDTMLVVVEPGQASIECALRIFQMAGQIGIRDIRMVANKITDVEDERFVRSALGGYPLLGMIPYCQGIRTADRSGESVLDHSGKPAAAAFADILASLETTRAKESCADPRSG